jgi:uncharacterized membrane protein YraQ (UPF0718 family)
MKLLLALILSINLTFAQTIKPINQGDTAPFTGYIIDKKFEQDRRRDRELLDVERGQTAVLKELGKVQVGRTEFYRDELKTAKREILKGQFKTVLYFVGGILVGGMSVYLGSKL